MNLPTCVICGRYGEYICDATDEDVCSLKCRDMCLSRRNSTTQELLEKQQQEEEELKWSEEFRRSLGMKLSMGSTSETILDNGTHSWPLPLLDFEQIQENAIGLPKELANNLIANKFKRPTPVQMQVIPCVLQGHHVLVSAPTGTGKTASYLIPAIAQVLRAREKKEEIMALVLAPVRELAIQIETVAKLLMRGIFDMKTALVVGGFPIPTQRYRLQSGNQLIVATPGRFFDIFTNYSGGDAILSTIRTCIIDEVDIMLDVGFRAQITQIVALFAAFTGKHHNGVQLLFFSATISDEVEALVRQVLKIQSKQAYLRVDVRSGCVTSSGTPSIALNTSVKQQLRWVVDKAKKDELFKFLKGRGEESTIVFVGSKLGATLLAEAIAKRCGIGAAAIHADKAQQERLRLLEAFVNLEIPVLVSTNVLSRGMDLLNVENVVVYDFPKKITEYVHLIGRTGRGGDVAGNALTLVNLEDRSLFRELVPLLRQAKVPVPREVYQSIHSEDTKKRARSNEAVIDESKRAFRIRQQLSDNTNKIASKWKEWDKQGRKRLKAMP
ncbi:unnamed protein product [Peronospora farinosa]|uniref:RNA helicase n=1 Tax=Peronospora farinosa TaxID=134698 RepID=A0AAV0SS00_9STRA|nr:unnamed protein product [Peronospora farinosa]